MPAFTTQCWHIVGVQHNGELAVAIITTADEIIDERQNALGALARLLGDGEDAKRRDFCDIRITEPLATRLPPGKCGTGALGHALGSRCPLDPLTDGRIANRA